VDLDAHPTSAPVVAKLFPELGITYTPPLPVRPILMSEEVDLPRDELLRVQKGINVDLYGYQLNDCAYTMLRMAQDGGGYLAWDMGLGKTIGAIAVANALLATKVLVVCNQSAKGPVWRDEVLTRSTVARRFINIGGSKAARERAVREFNAEAGPCVAAVHPEALRLVVADLPAVDLVVFDEAHKLAKGAERGREVPLFYKALKKIRTKYKLCLSGSVIVNSPADVFGALHWLFPKAYKNKWRDWNDRFLRFVDGYQGRKVFVDVRRDKLEEMRRELGTVMCVRYKDDELEGLPPVVERDLYVDLSPAQRRVYDEMAKRFMAELPDDTTIMATSVAVQMIRLRQIASGLDLMAGDVVDSTKLDLALELIAENAPKPTVVFCWHRAAVDALVSRLGAAGHRAVAVHGGVPQRDRDAAVQAFQSDPNVVAIVATIKTLGESVNLNRASDVVFVESSWTPVDMAQARDRVAGGLRQKGRTGRVNVTRIVARDTVDQHRVLPALLNKQSMRNLILGGK
jgi:SNF2 family DNA or RNA helicase